MGDPNGDGYIDTSRWYIILGDNVARPTEGIICIGGMTSICSFSSSREAGVAGDPMGDGYIDTSRWY